LSFDLRAVAAYHPRLLAESAAGPREGTQAMKINIRKTTRKRDKRGFRYRMKTRHGRKIINRRRRIGAKMPGTKKRR
jgi:ribosomal protein L34